MYCKTEYLFFVMVLALSTSLRDYQCRSDSLYQVKQATGKIHGSDESGDISVIQPRQGSVIVQNRENNKFLKVIKIQLSGAKTTFWPDCFGSYNDDYSYKSTWRLPTKSPMDQIYFHGARIQYNDGVWKCERHTLNDAVPDPAFVVTETLRIWANEELKNVRCLSVSESSMSILTKSQKHRCKFLIDLRPIPKQLYIVGESQLRRISNA